MIDVEGYYPYFDNYYGVLDHFNRENINLMNMYRVYTTDSPRQGYIRIRIGIECMHCS